MHHHRRMRALPLILPLFVALLLTGCARVAKPEGWATPLITPEGAFASLEDGKLSSLLLPDAGGASVTWTFPRKTDKGLTLKGIYQLPVADADRVFVASYGDGVFALNRSDGSPIWHRQDFGESIVSAFAAVGDSSLAVGTTDGRLHLIKRSDGSPANAPAWPAKGRKLSGGIWASLVVTDTTIFAATMSGYVYAFDIATGAPKWPTPFHANGAIPELALLSPDRLFVPSLSRNVYIVDVASGQSAVPPLKANAWVWTQPAVKDGIAFFGDFSGRVYALNITTGIPAWTFSSGARIKAPPLVLGDTVLVADRSPAVHFLRRTDGSKLNTVPLSDAKNVRAGLAALNGASLGLVLSTNGKLYRANPQELSVIEIPIGGGQ